MTTHDHPPLPPLLHELPPFQWEGQASPRVYLRDMSGRRGWSMHEDVTPQDGDLEDWHLHSYHSALAA